MWINVLSGNRHLSEYSGNAPNGCTSHVVFVESHLIPPGHYGRLQPFNHPIDSWSETLFFLLLMWDIDTFFDFGLYSQKRRWTLALFGPGTYRPYDSGISTCLKVCSNITHMDLTANGWRFIFLSSHVWRSQNSTDILDYFFSLSGCFF